MKHEMLTASSTTQSYSTLIDNPSRLWCHLDLGRELPPNMLTTFFAAKSFTIVPREEGFRQLGSTVYDLD